MHNTSETNPVWVTLFLLKLIHLILIFLFILFISGSAFYSQVLKHLQSLKSRWLSILLTQLLIWKCLPSEITLEIRGKKSQGVKAGSLPSLWAFLSWHIVNQVLSLTLHHSPPQGLSSWKKLCPQSRQPEITWRGLLRGSMTWSCTEVCVNVNCLLPRRCIIVYYI